MKINPLTKKQTNIVCGIETDRDAGPFRILANDHAVDLFTGSCCYENCEGDSMHHPMYFDRSKTAIYQILRFMRENNPGVRFRVSYH